MPDTVRVRFAPSPTGSFHVGSARTALFNWAFARRHQGTFVLRIEDTDRSRSTEEYITPILDVLRWLGLEWDEGPPAPGYRQTERFEIYRYPGTCRDVKVSASEPHALRLKVPTGGQTVVDDAILGAVSFDNGTLDDWILVRTDGTPTYNFCAVVDDVTMKITHVIRGNDHLNNTPKQLACYAALGYPTPV